MLDQPPTVDGLVRTNLSDIKRQLSEAQREVAEHRARADKAVADCTYMADFIRTRVGSQSWDHADVLAIVDTLFTRLHRSILSTMTDADKRGTPMGVTAARRIVHTRFEQARASLMQAVGEPGEQPALHRPEVVTDRMRAELKAVTRLDAA